LSKLLGDVKRRKEAAEEVIRTLDPDLRERKIERIPYSHKIFHQAAVEWLVATDQVSDFIFLTGYDSNLFTAHSSTRTYKI
jgi:hypothetical protein